MKKLALTIAAAALIGFAGSAVAADPQDGCLGASNVFAIESEEPPAFGVGTSAVAKNMDVAAFIQSFIATCDPSRGRNRDPEPE